LTTRTNPDAAPRRGLTRRQVITGASAVPASLTTGSAAYARWVEPGSDIHVAHHAPRPARWPDGLKLRIAALSDLHCGSVHMPLARIEEIVERTHALKPDLILLLGDYVCPPTGNVHGLRGPDWAGALARLQAPLGVHAIVGNHEYWDDHEIKRTRQGISAGQAALEAAGIATMINRAEKIQTPEGAFWLAGLDDQLCFWIARNTFIGRDDLKGTLAQVTDDAPVILMAHEPDLFVDVPERVALTLSGHTHGGQVKVFGWSPYIPSNYGSRFQHGLIIEEGRHLIVSAGLGTSGPPMRFGVPPEIVVVDLGGAAAA
jgi:uncharacterized protein